MEIINENEYQDKVKSGVVLVDFFANWCAPCRMMTPILEEVAEELAESISIYKVDVDEDENLARKFGIMSIPTIFVYVDGVIKEKHLGLWMKEDLIDTIKKYI